MQEGLKERNALIKSTFLGGGIFTFWLNLDYGGAGQGAGGYGLDTSVDGERVGTASGLTLIMEILKTLRVESWEELPGTFIRVRHNDNRIHAIGHILENRWLDFSEFWKEQRRDREQETQLARAAVPR